MEKCYNCGEEAVIWLGDIEDTERGILETNYYCRNCNVDIIVYKELELNAYRKPLRQKKI